MPDRRGTEPMYGDDPTDPAHSPVDDQDRTPVGGEEGKGWRYLPFERDEATGEHRITIVHEEDGEEIRFTVPSFVEQGDELGEITLLVIRARRRWRELKGLGG
jgi:hypothetical protein